MADRSSPSPPTAPAATDRAVDDHQGQQEVAQAPQEQQPAGGQQQLPGPCHSQQESQQPQSEAGQCKLDRGEGGAPAAAAAATTTAATTADARDADNADGGAGDDTTCNKDKRHEIEIEEEKKLKAKYPQVQRPGSQFLQKRLQRGQKYFDSGDYNMAKAAMKPK